MKILLVSPEVLPFAKTGGLADVTGALPKELEKLGVEVKVMMPRYKTINEDNFKIEKIDMNVNVPIGAEAKSGNLSKGRTGRNVDVFFIGNEEYFDRDGLYGDISGDYKDNLQRFTFFCRGCLEALKLIDWKPDIIHCHDWQSGLVPAYLKTIYRNDPFYRDINTVFTIHNLAYQGNYPPDMYYITGLSWEEFVFEKIEYYGKFSLIKAGIVYSDFITTVSETYSKEIQTKDFGCGLEGVLEWRAKDLYGIINGIDYTIWNPEIDGLIEKQYSLKTVEDKVINKEKLLELSGLPVIENRRVPLIGMISRLAEQKGFDLIEGCIEDLMALDIQFIILGTGEEKYHNLLNSMNQKFPEKIAIHLKFDEGLAHLIYAGSDMFVMPSKYEPCGLGQLIAMKYGTVPIVHKTGGLADTVKEFSLNSKIGNGFVFEVYLPNELISTLKRALNLYNDSKSWKILTSNCMKSDFSWKESAKKYLELFKKLKSEI